MTDVTPQLQKQIADFEQMMNLKIIQGKDRMIKVAEFGEIGMKKDCAWCDGRSCRILRELFCKSEVCHFYTKEGDF